MKKYLLLIPAALFPYGFVFTIYKLVFKGSENHIIENYFHNNVYELFGIVLIVWFVFAVLTVICGIMALRKGSSRSMAVINLVIKCLQIPVYAVLFVMSVFTAAFVLIPLMSFFADALTIALSGTFGAFTAARARREGKLDTLGAVVLAVTQYIFCVDLICAAVLLVQSVRSRPSQNHVK